MSSPSPLQGVEQLPVTVDGFLKTVLRSGLMLSPQLQQVLQPVPPERLQDAKFLANLLVKAGKLSRFQATKLLQGVTKGLVLGPYHVLAPIGKGGMGAVYLARDSRTQMLAAVKVLPPKRAKAEERLLARFKREMEMCQRVAHPNVARTFEVGAHDDVNYIAMEYIPGKNLYKLISEQGPLAVPRAARLFQEICLGLEHAHTQGLIHRDLKPSNIVITPDDHPKVLDLGLALIQGEVAADRTVVGGQGYIVGTLDYLAPEQADDAFNVDIRSDIYSLGCTLYFALTKQPPFPGGNALQKLLRHRVDVPPSVLRLNSSVPPELGALVERMMAKRKEERFATAAEVREALKAWAPDGPKVAPAPEAAPKPVPVNAATEMPKSALEPAAPPPSSTASFVVKRNAVATLRMPPLPRLSPPAAEAAPPAAKPKEEPPSWFAEMAQQQAKSAPLPEAIPMPQVPGQVDLPAPPAILVPDYVPSSAGASPSPPGASETPFWLDYFVPVCAGAGFLFVAWLIGLTWLLRR